MNNLYNISLALFPIVMAITLHEVAHGWVALKLGDPTAKLLGRLTANPIKHIDPIGTVIMPIAMLLVTGFAFGYAKPVPVDVRNFKHPNKDMAIVALAGPFSNLIMALFWMLVLAMAEKIMPAGALTEAAKYMASVGVIINILLMVVNLLPILPLDGGRVVVGILPDQMAAIYSRFERVGLLLVILLLFTGYLDKILSPIIQMVQKNLLALFGLS